MQRAPSEASSPIHAGFSGWRVLITGGSSGIGLALGRSLARSGAHVCLAARDPARLAAAVDDLRSAARSADQSISWVELDVTSTESVARAVPRVLTELGGLDLLVNNAGSAIPGYIDQLDEEAYREMLAVNYLGPVRLVRAFLPHFLARRSGHILNVASMLGFMGTFGYAAYAASKHALCGFTECLRQDLLPFGIRVHLCYAPTTKTPGLVRENLVKPPEAWAIEGTSRAFEPEEVAAAILSGVRRGRFHIVVGFDSWLIWVAQRFAPWLVRLFTDRVLVRHLREHGDGRAKLASRSLPPAGPRADGDGPS
jgi:3-dehydrosphinganine reductase